MKKKLETESLLKNGVLIKEEALKKRYYYQLTKRIIDIIGSCLGLVVLIPVFIAVAIALKLEEMNAPIIFTQTRIGKNGKKFKMYKFRSMCLDAEDMLQNLLQQNEIEGAMFKIKEDPRVTKVGKFIRKTSIDELPQFWNVFKGNMSLVGPRPPLEREFDEYTTYDKQRLFTKPGCTGIWQISGRNNVNFNDMVSMDISYINNQSVILDLKIIIKTIWIMLKPNGAY